MISFTVKENSDLMILNAKVVLFWSNNYIFQIGFYLAVYEDCIIKLVTKIFNLIKNNLFIKN